MIVLTLCTIISQAHTPRDQNDDSAVLVVDDPLLEQTGAASTTAGREVQRAATAEAKVAPKRKAKAKAKPKIFARARAAAAKARAASMAERGSSQSMVPPSTAATATETAEMPTDTAAATVQAVQTQGAAEEDPPQAAQRFGFVQAKHPEVLCQHCEKYVDAVKCRLMSKGQNTSTF